MIETRPIAQLQAGAWAVLDQAIAEHAPSKVFALFSGGHDSLSVTHLAAQHPAFSGVVHINTTIGLPETRRFVRETCAREGWPLHVLRPPWTFLQLVVGYGFPGPPSHTFMYRYLKERPLMAFIQRQKRRTKTNKPDPKDRIVLVGGMRSRESVRRMGHVEPIHRAGAVVWTSPIHDWNEYEPGAYLAAMGLPRNPVKDLLHLSGECFCGSFAAPMERRELEAFYPDFVRTVIAPLESLVQAAALLPLELLPSGRIAKQARQWGNGGPIPAEQLELLPMCHFCREAA